MMNTLVRASVFGFSLLASTLAQARTFSATLKAAPSEAYLNATATVNYSSKTLTVSLQPRMPVCPEGRMCIQAFPPAVTTTYTRVKSVVNKCGVIQTTATTKQSRIVLVNNSQNTCENEPELIASLDIKNPKGQVVDAFLSARDVTVALEGAGIGSYQGGSFVLNRASGDLSVTLQTEGESFELFFSNAVTTTSGCGVVQTVADVYYSESQERFFTVTIHDNRKNTCPTFAPLAAWDMVVRSSVAVDFNEADGVDVNQLKTEE